ADQIRDELRIRIARFNIARLVIGAIVQCDVSGIGMEHGNDLCLSAPARDIIEKELHMKDGSREIALKSERTYAEDRLHSVNFHGNVDMQCAAFAGHHEASFIYG